MENNNSTEWSNTLKGYAKSEFLRKNPNSTEEAFERDWNFRSQIIVTPDEAKSERNAQKIANGLVWFLYIMIKFILLPAFIAFLITLFFPVGFFLAFMALAVIFPMVRLLL